MKFKSSKKKIYLCSFSSPDLEKSRVRFLKQAKKIDIYKKIKIYNFSDLDEFTKKNIKYYLNKGNYKGYGYYCWKPYIVNDFLKRVPKNSIIQYLDIGFHINPQGIKKLKYYIKLCEKKNFINFMYKKSNFKKLKKFRQQLYYEYQFSKRDLWEKFKINENDKILRSGQILAGCFFIKKNKYTSNIINDWLKLSKIRNLIDDNKSKNIELKKFIQHRHDQSILSLLCKKNKTHTLSASELDFAYKNGKKTWEHLRDFPFLAKRDIDFGLFKKVFNKINQIIKS